jgi:hypothetical protein
MRYAMVNADNVVINVIMWDGESPYTPPLGCFLVQSDTANIGDIYDPNNGTFTPPQQ